MKRTKFPLVALVGLVAGAGCDNVTAGQSSDPAGPPQLVHVLVQDARYLLAFPNRASSVDIIDKGTTPVACSDTPPVNPCLVSFLVDQVSPDVSCKNGFCTDPFLVPATGVPVPLSATLIGAAPDYRDPGGGVQVRLVFSKVLDSSIETITMDPTKAPGKTNTYMFGPGILELDDEAGKPVPSVFYLDNGGSPEFSSDLELVPLGPALVIKPKAPLDAATTYTVKILNAGVIKDRQGNAATAQGGGALPTSMTFKTEALTPAAAGAFGSGVDYPDLTKPGMITPNEVIQIGFYEAIAGDTATVTFTSAPAGVKAIAFSDRGGDPTMCPTAASGDPSGNVLDIVNTDTGNVATGVPVDWPAGDYTFTVTVKDVNGKSTYTSDPMKFTVTGTAEMDPTVDPNISAAHVTPAQCMM